MSGVRARTWPLGTVRGQIAVTLEVRMQGLGEGCCGHVRGQLRTRPVSEVGHGRRGHAPGQSSAMAADMAAAMAAAATEASAVRSARGGHADRTRLVALDGPAPPLHTFRPPA